MAGCSRFPLHTMAANVGPGPSWLLCTIPAAHGPFCVSSSFWWGTFSLLLMYGCHEPCHLGMAVSSPGRTQCPNVLGHLQEGWGP